MIGLPDHWWVCRVALFLRGKYILIYRRCCRTYYLPTWLVRYWGWGCRGAMQMMGAMGYTDIFGRGSLWDLWLLASRGIVKRRVLRIWERIGCCTACKFLGTTLWPCSCARQTRPVLRAGWREEFHGPLVPSSMEWAIQSALCDPANKLRCYWCAPGLENGARRARSDRRTRMASLWNPQSLSESFVVNEAINCSEIQMQSEHGMKMDRNSENGGWLWSEDLRSRLVKVSRQWDCGDRIRQITCPRTAGWCTRSVVL